MADSKVVKEQEFITDEVAKCKQGVCPNDSIDGNDADAAKD